MTLRHTELFLTILMLSINWLELTIQEMDFLWESGIGFRTIQAKKQFSSDTEIGRVSAEHAPVFSVGVAANSGLIKKAYMSIKFNAPSTVAEALYRMGRVLQFLDIMVGYRQNVSEITYTRDTIILRIPRTYIRQTIRTPYFHNEDEPSFQTILIDPVHNAEHFSSVLQAWLRRDDRWYNARVRLSRILGKRIYNYDRIIAAANVFDLLPREDYGGSTPLRMT